MKNLKFITAAIVTITASAIVLGHSAAKAEPANQTERNRKLVAEGLQAWADGIGSPYDLLASDVRWTITGNSAAAKTYLSKAAFIGEVIQPFNARMQSRLIPTVHRLYAEGDTVVAHFDAKAVARDGVPYANSYVWILRLKNGQIIEATAFFDAHAFDNLWRRVVPASTR